MHIQNNMTRWVYTEYKLKAKRHKQTIKDPPDRGSSVYGYCNNSTEANNNTVESENKAGLTP